MKLYNRKSLRLVAFALGALLLQACSSSSNSSTPPPPPPPPPPAMASFDVSVVNLTGAQPLSPVAVIAHQDGYAVFMIGTAATTGLEELAEGGDNTALLAEADADANVLASASGAAPIGPAGSETINIEVLETDLPGLLISVSTMLVNTNDAISGINGVAVGDMAVGDVVSLRAIAYDSGTEANTELAGEIPGPAGGGEGFNAARSDRVDIVAMHSGVISQDDGLATSDLTGQHRFDNPVSQIRIERIN